MYIKFKFLKGIGYDVVFVFVYFIEKMGCEGLLVEIDYN